MDFAHTWKGWRFIKGSSIGKKAFFPIYLVNFIGTLGFSIVLPFLVFVVEKFEGTVVLYGLLGSTYPAFQMIGAPLLGRLSDRVGRKKVLLITQTGTFLSWGIFLMAFYVPNRLLMTVEGPVIGSVGITLPLAILFLARALDGLTGGNISVANAYLADISSKEDRSRNFGRLSMSANLGFVLGPAIAGLLGSTILREQLPVIFAALISLAAILIIAFYLPNIVSHVVKRLPQSSNQRKVFGQEVKECYQKVPTKEKGVFLECCKRRLVGDMFLLNFLIFFGFSIFYTAFPVHAARGLSWSTAELGIFFAVLSLMMAASQGPILSRLSIRLSEGTLMVVGSFLLSVNFVLLTSSNVVTIYFAAILFAIGNGMMWPSFLSTLSKLAGDRQGAIQGYASSFGSAASILGLILGGIFYARWGASAFLFSAAILGLASILSLRLVRFSHAEPDPVPS